MVISRLKNMQLYLTILWFKQLNYITIMKRLFETFICNCWYLIVSEPTFHQILCVIDLVFKDKFSWANTNYNPRIEFSWKTFVLIRSKFPTQKKVIMSFKGELRLVKHAFPQYISHVTNNNHLFFTPYSI